MAYYCLYNIATGTLLDIANTPPDEVPAECALSVSEGEIPDRYFYSWSNEHKMFESRAGIERSVSILQFLNRLTAVERIAIKEAAKVNIALSDYMDMLNIAQFVDLDDPILYGGLSFLVYLGLIEPNRISEILQ